MTVSRLGTSTTSSDLLADKAIPGANDIGSLENWAERVTRSAQSGKNAAGKSMWQGEVDTLEF
jgi:hypothetical protein